MKKHLFFSLALLPVWLGAQERILVIADPHVLASSLVEPGQAFDNMMNGQRKMLDLSEEAWYAMMDTAIKYKPALVLIPGDLTKDSEKASHELVAASLNQLREAGIPSFVIPGNHDIGGAAYAYKGEEQVPVESLSDAEWESMYAFVYEQATAKDPNSHSYVTEPMKGLTVMGIDGSENAASIGSLSEQTLAWLLAQADSAVAKQNMIIALCHWQILEHFDKQGTLESACRMKNADDLRDSLMHHGVHLVLTGHFHVNGITTYRDTTGLTQDSIVEITTGSPITYPCPYRWLTVSKDLSSVEVNTETIGELEHYPDLYIYSREWMSEHASMMVPALALRAWTKVDSRWDSQIVPALNAMGLGWIAPYLKELLPATDEDRIAIIEKYFGSTVVELYLLHSDGNEPEYPEADSLAQAVYAGMEGMIHELTDNSIIGIPSTQNFMIGVAKEMIQESLQSLVEDKTQWSFGEHADRTDDLHLTLCIAEPKETEGVEQTEKENVPAAKQIRHGQLYIIRNGQVYTVQGQLTELAD